MTWKKTIFFFSHSCTIRHALGDEAPATRIHLHSSVRQGNAISNLKNYRKLIAVNTFKENCVSLYQNRCSFLFFQKGIPSPTIPTHIMQSCTNKNSLSPSHFLFLQMLMCVFSQLIFFLPSLPEGTSSSKPKHLIPIILFQAFPCLAMTSLN